MSARPANLHGNQPCREFLSVLAATLSRQFRAQVGATPAHWIAGARIRHAQRLLETTGFDVERVATETGFGSATVMRQHFARIVGTTPLAYRRAFSHGRP